MGARAATRGDTSDQAVGTIVGDVATQTFQFQVEASDVEATQYIRFDHEDERFLAQVIQIEREAGSKDQEGELLADAKVIGRRDDNGRLSLPKTPPKPGTTVERAGSDLVRSVMNMDDSGAFMGRLRGLDLPVHLDVNSLVQKHCSVLAKTGAGKSYTLGVLMEELLEHEVPLVTVDPHGEHSTLEAPNASDADIPAMREFGIKPTSFEDQVVEYAPDQDAVPDAEPFRLDENNLSARDITELLEDGLTSAQTGTLHQAIRELDDPNYGLEDIIHSVEQQSGSSKWPVLHALEDLQDLGILSPNPTPIDELVQDGQATILNLKGLSPNVQQLVVARVAEQLFEARKVGLVDPHLFVMEEAHNFCPERHLSKAASGEIVQTIASEGRKFGMGLAVISQRPAKVDKNVLSQCNTQITLKVTNANDLKAITKSVENLPDGIEDEIQALQVGTALVSDPSIAVPFFCQIRPRRTRHGGSSIEVVRDGDAEVPTQAETVVEPEPDPEPEPEPSESASEPATAQAEPQAEAEADVEFESSPVEDPQPSEDPRLRRLADIEETLLEADISQLQPGELEQLLVEIEQLLRVLDELSAEHDVDQARVAGLRSGLRAQHRRTRQHL